MECGQAVQEDSVFGSEFHYILRYLIGRKIFNTLFPDFVRFAHRYPYVGVYDVGVFDRRGYLLCERDRAAAFFGVAFTYFNKPGIGEVFRRSACRKVKSQLRAYDHKGISGIISGVA